MRTALGSRPVCVRLGVLVRWDMDNRRRIRRRGFWALALLWLPLGVFATAAVLFWTAPGAWRPMTPASAISLMPCGLPLALACQRIWWLGWRRAAWAMGAVLGGVTAPLVAGLPGPLAIAAWAFVLSLPAWLAWWWLPEED